VIVSRLSRCCWGTCTLLTAILVACFGDGPSVPIQGAQCSPTGPYLGEFEGSMAGAVNEAAAGCAYFIVEPATDCGSSEYASKFNLIVSNGQLGQFEHAMALIRCGATLPRGTFTVGPAPVGLAGRLKEVGSNRIFELTSGSVTVTWSETATIVGSLAVTATEVDGTDTVVVSGTFTARCVDPNAPLIGDGGKQRGEPYTDRCTTKAVGSVGGRR
jgi:hypothetical protein